jgi:hypothetical protein
MRESRTYGSGRGACDETHVPTATCNLPCFRVNDACYFDVRDSKRPIGFSAANP